MTDRLATGRPPSPITTLRGKIGSGTSEFRNWPRSGKIASNPHLGQFQNSGGAGFDIFVGCQSGLPQSRCAPATPVTGGKHNGRHLHQGEAIRGHGAGSVAGECGDRVEVDCDLSLARDHGVAAEPARVWAAGLCVSCAAGRRVCRWLLLARVSPALQRSRQPCGLLAAEARREPDARSAGDAHAHTGGLEGASNLGARSEGRRTPSRRARVEGTHARAAVRGIRKAETCVQGATITASLGHPCDGASKSTQVHRPAYPPTKQPDSIGVRLRRSCRRRVRRTPTSSPWNPFRPFSFSIWSLFLWPRRLDPSGFSFARPTARLRLRSFASLSAT